MNQKIYENANNRYKVHSSYFNFVPSGSSAVDGSVCCQSPVIAVESVVVQSAKYMKRKVFFWKLFLIFEAKNNVKLKAVS